MKKPPDGIWIIDENGQTLFANQRMADILGTSPSEMIGHPSFAYVFREDVAHAQRLLDGKKLGDINPFHFKLRRKDGSVVCVDVSRNSYVQRCGQIRIVGTFSVST
jgi:PAS domain S-box-containing protein